MMMMIIIIIIIIINNAVSTQGSRSCFKCYRPATGSQLAVEYSNSQLAHCNPYKVGWEKVLLIRKM
jgi:hypothetical protein